MSPPPGIHPCVPALLGRSGLARVLRTARGGGHYGCDSTAGARLVGSEPDAGESDGPPEVPVSDRPGRVSGGRVDVGTADLRGALHEAVLYSTPDELAQRLVPRLQPSLDDGGPVVAVLDEPTRAAVR